MEDDTTEPTDFSFKDNARLLETSKGLHGVLKEACMSCRSSTISLSGGLDSTILAYLLKGKRPDGVAIVVQDFVATDLTYCQMASKQFAIPLTILNVGTTEILNAIDETIKILKNFNDIEIRNSIVMYLSIKWAKEQGKQGIITGDGADELFAGYNFLISKSGEDLEKEMQRVWGIMHFPSQKIGDTLGIKVESPFLDEGVVEFAKGVPPEFKVRDEGEEEKKRRYGKWILRKAFESNIPRQIAWRQKSPMQDGAGTSGLTDLFESIMDNATFEERRKGIEESDGVVIRSKESMYYYEVYRKLYGNPSSRSGHACPYCKHHVGESKFCRMCGAFPI